LFFGVDINLEANFWISIISAGGILTYTILLSSVSYSQTQQRIETKNQLKNKSRELQNISQKLSEFLPSQLVDNISEGKVDSVSTHRRKKLTMFFSDIKDFTKITDTLEPEDMANIINEYITEMNIIIIKHKGTLAQVIGDGLYIFFGAPKNTNDKDNAIKCLKMAMDMQLKMKKLNQKWFILGIDKELEIRCGINTGMATVGGYGSSERKEYTAMGMQVNIAARLESACTPGKILMSHTTWVLVKDDIPYLEKGEFEIKGYHLPIKVYEVQV
jgi:class 3 adenylate cyclase